MVARILNQKTFRVCMNITIELSDVMRLLDSLYDKLSSSHGPLRMYVKYVFNVQLH